jgi:hypothetical protein
LHARDHHTFAKVEVACAFRGGTDWNNLCLLAWFETLRAAAFTRAIKRTAHGDAVIERLRAATPSVETATKWHPHKPPAVSEQNANRSIERKLKREIQAESKT